MCFPLSGWSRKARLVLSEDGRISKKQSFGQVSRMRRGCISVSSLVHVCLLLLLLHLAMHYGKQGRQWPWNQQSNESQFILQTCLHLPKFFVCLLPKSKKNTSSECKTSFWELNDLLKQNLAITSPFYDALHQKNKMMATQQVWI